MLTLIAPYGCVLPGVVWSPAAAPGEGALSDCHQQGDPLPWSNDPNLVTAPLQGHAAAWDLTGISGNVIKWIRSTAGFDPLMIVCVYTSSLDSYPPHDLIYSQGNLSTSFQNCRYFAGLLKR